MKNNNAPQETAAFRAAGGHRAGEPEWWLHLAGLTFWALLGLGLLMTLVFNLSLGRAWAWGAALGALLACLNVAALRGALSRLAVFKAAPVSPKPYLAGFFIAFGLTVMAISIIVKSRLGHPLAFLAGLLLLGPALGLAVIGRLLFKPAPRPPGKA